MICIALVDVRLAVSCMAMETRSIRSLTFTVSFLQAMQVLRDTGLASKATEQINPTDWLIVTNTCLFRILGILDQYLNQILDQAKSQLEKHRNIFWYLLNFLCCWSQIATIQRSSSDYVKRT